MKNSLIIIFAILITMFISCNQKETNNVKVNYTETVDVTASLSKAQVVGIINDNMEPTIVLETSALLSQWNKLVKIDESLTALLIFRENNNYYLRASGKTYASTIELSLENTAQGNQVLYLTGNTICTSNACSSGGGCLPQAAYCSDCTKGSKDCERSTSNKTPFTPIALLDDYQYLQ